MFKSLARFALAIMGIIPTAIHAQAFGASFGGWMTTGAKEGNDPATGFRLSGSYDRPFQANARWRIEGAFVQAGFTRDFPSKPNRHVTENSLELAAHWMSPAVGVARVRAFLGPVLTVGIGCGTDGSNDANGRIACNGDGGDGTARVGVALGLHAEWGSARQFTLSLQGQGNTVAAARGKGPAMFMGFGIRFPR